MRSEILIDSSYEAAFLAIQGFDYKVVLRPDGQDADFAFRAGKELHAARKRYETDSDLQEFIEAFRRLEWTVKNALRDRSTNEAPRSRR